MSNPLNFRFGGAKRLVDEVTAQRLNAMLDEIRRAKPLPGKGVSVRQESHGVRIDALGKGGGGGGAAQKRQPWDIYVAAKQEGTYTLRVQPGTLARVLPSNWDEEFTVGEDTLLYGVATATTDGRAVTEVSISMGAAPPTISETLKFAVPSEVKFVFGLFKDGKSYNAAGGADISVTGQIVLVASADPAADPGESPFDLYYRLQ
jgi:hypothetical protein